jgi:hypothetical protein
MSTPSRIILKVRKEDIGRKIKFDPIKLPLPLKEWIETDKNGKVLFDQRGKDLCRVVTLKGDYIGIYCHWDGYPDSVGETLKKHFNNYETALNLLVGGFCSGIACGHVAHYANRYSEKWSDIKPIQGSLNKVYETMFGYYTYLFEDGMWKVSKIKENFHKF